MKYRQRTFCTDKQKSEMWDRWQRGESLSSIGRRFDRASSSVFSAFGTDWRHPAAGPNEIPVCTDLD